MKKIIPAAILMLVFLSCNVNKKQATLLKDCPEEKIVNKMPMMTDGDSKNELPREYYIYKGERKEIKDFDAIWLAANCTITVTEVH